MRRIDEELAAAAAVLLIIDRRRAEAGDSGLGSAIERTILDRCLADLERDPGRPAPRSLRRPLTLNWPPTDREAAECSS